MLNKKIISKIFMLLQNYFYLFVLTKNLAKHLLYTNPVFLNYFNFFCKTKNK